MNAKYMELVARFPLLPIISKRMHASAKKMMIELTKRDGELSDAEIGYGKVLTQLIENYEQQLVGNFFKDVSGEDVLEYLCNEHQLKQSEIAAIAGISKQNLNDYLKGRRGLSKKACLRLAAHFKLNPEVFYSMKELEVA